MSWIIESLHHLSLFMHQGGAVLWWLAIGVFVCWLIVLERVLFLYFVYPNQQQQWITAWQKRTDHHSWYALSIREAWLDQAHGQLIQYLVIIKALVGIFPMLGLLGTVTGMISVFDAMALKNSADPSVMASGISLATLPTMVGMVAALVGLFAHARLQRACLHREWQLEQRLRSE